MRTSVSPCSKGAKVEKDATVADAMLRYKAGPHTHNRSLFLLNSTSASLRDDLCGSGTRRLKLS
jgi:hypothetical protein